MGVLGEFGPYLVVFGRFSGILEVFVSRVVRVGKYQAAEARRPPHRQKHAGRGRLAAPDVLLSLCVTAALRLRAFMFEARGMASGWIRRRACRRWLN